MTNGTYFTHIPPRHPPHLIPLFPLHVIHRKPPPITPLNPTPNPSPGAPIGTHTPLRKLPTGKNYPSVSARFHWVHASGVVRQHNVLRGVLGRFWEGFWGRVLRMVLRRGPFSMGFTSEKASQKGCWVSRRCLERPPRSAAP